MSALEQAARAVADWSVKMGKQGFDRVPTDRIDSLRAALDAAPPAGLTPGADLVNLYRHGIAAKFREPVAAAIDALLDAAPPAGLREALEKAVSNALSAATEGSDYLEAPEPSDEPGSEYVRTIAASLAAAGVGFALDAAPPAGLRVTDVLRVLADLEAREEAHPLGKPFAQVRGAVLSLASLTGADAAPSCGHPLDADRLKLRLSRAAEGNVYLDIAHVCDLIDQEAAAYAGEGE